MLMQIWPNNWRITYVLLYPLLGVSVLNRKTFSRLIVIIECFTRNEMKNNLGSLT